MNDPVFDVVKELSAQGRYSDALSKIDSEESMGRHSAPLLVWKARLLQLVDDSGSLDEVENTLERAIQLDPANAEAFLELGWFQLNVADNPSKALEFFQNATRIQVPANTDAVLGILKCKRELQPTVAPETMKSEAILNLVDMEKIQESLKD